MSGSVFPPGDEPGSWLMRVNALAGVSYPLWNESYLRYPPLFFLMCRAISLAVGDGLTALKLGAVLVFAGIPLSTYLFARRIAGSSIVGLGASLLAAFSPAQFEMLWRGAYPNLLGVFLMPLALLMLLDAQGGDVKVIAAAMVFGGLVLASHQSTLVVYMAILIVVLLLATVLRGKSALRTNLPIVGVVLLLSGLYWVSAGSGYVLQNSALVTSVGFSSDMVLGLFKSPYLLLLGVVLAAVGSVQLLLAKRSLELTLVLGWLGVSLLLSLTGFLGMLVDVRGFLLLSVVPLSVLCSVPLLYLWSSLAVSKSAGSGWIYEVEVQVEKAAPVALALIALLATPAVGLMASRSALALYTWESRYSDQEMSQVLDWIKENSEANATIVSDSHLGPWIEGYAQRRALFAKPLESALSSDDFERSMASDAILSSSHQLANRYLKLDDTQPMWSHFSPRVFVFKGSAYVPLVYVDGAFVRVNLTRGGRTWIEAPYNVLSYQSRWLGKDGGRATLQHSLETLGLLLTEELSVGANDATASVRFAVVAKEDVTLNSASMVVWLDWGRSILESWTDGNRVKVKTDIGEVELSFIGDVVGVEVGKDKEFNQSRVLTRFRTLSDRCEMEIDVRVPNADSSWISGVWAVSSSGLEKRYGVELVAVRKQSYEEERLRSWIATHVLGYREVFTSSELSVFEVPRTDSIGLLVGVKG